MDELRLKKNVGKPFFQRESLTKRINDILRSYSSTTCIFNELIQNADDAKATEIRNKTNIYFKIKIFYFKLFQF
jgi:hypothetical protein